MNNYHRDRTYCYERYHVSLGTKRTTISIDKTLSILMSLHLGTQPNTPSAHLAVRQWLQGRLDDNKDADQVRVSQWLHGKLTEALITGELKQKYDAWSETGWIKYYPPQADHLTERDRSM